MKGGSHTHIVTSHMKQRIRGEVRHAGTVTRDELKTDNWWGNNPKFIRIGQDWKRFIQMKWFLAKGCSRKLSIKFHIKPGSLTSHQIGIDITYINHLHLQLCYIFVSKIGSAIRLTCFVTNSINWFVPKITLSQQHSFSSAFLAREGNSCDKSDYRPSFAFAELIVTKETIFIDNPNLYVCIYVCFAANLEQRLSRYILIWCFARKKRFRRSKADGNISWYADDDYTDNVFMISLKWEAISIFFFLSSLFLFLRGTDKACQWIKCHACKWTESAWINRSRVAATCRDHSDLPAMMIGRTCKSILSPILSTISAWVWTSKWPWLCAICDVKFSPEIAVVSYEPDDDVKDKKLGTLNNEVIPFYLEKLEDIARDNNGHLSCGKVTFAFTHPP